jgi:hypothetical protein
METPLALAMRIARRFFSADVPLFRNAAAQEPARLGMHDGHMPAEFVREFENGRAGRAAPKMTRATGGATTSARIKNDEISCLADH